MTEAELVAELRASKKYGGVSEELITRIVRRELRSESRAKEVLKSAKRKLHQVVGAYLEHTRDATEWPSEITSAAARGDDALHRACLELMRSQSSTAERIEILDEFYSTVLADVGPVRHVADVACGLAPLARGWMPLDEDVEYAAYDVWAPIVNTVNAFFDAAGYEGRAEARDVVGLTIQCDLAIVLKSLPCLDQIERGAGKRLLQSIEAPAIVASFPVRSLGGRAKGMRDHYDAYISKILEDEGWDASRYDFATEVAYVVRKP